MPHPWLHSTSNEQFRDSKVLGSSGLPTSLAFLSGSVDVVSEDTRSVMCHVKNKKEQLSNQVKRWGAHCTSEWVSPYWKGCWLLMLSYTHFKCKGQKVSWLKFGWHNQGLWKYIISHKTHIVLSMITTGKEFACNVYYLKKSFLVIKANSYQVSQGKSTIHACKMSYWSIRTEPLLCLPRCFSASKFLDGSYRIILYGQWAHLRRRFNPFFRIICAPHMKHAWSWGRHTWSWTRP